MKKNIFLVGIAAVTALCAVQPAFSFTNNSWLHITSYEERKTYPVDKEEAAKYLLEFYDSLAQKKNPDNYQTIIQDPYYSSTSYAQQAYAAGLINDAYMSKLNSSITVREFCSLAVDILEKVYPENKTFVSDETKESLGIEQEDPSVVYLMSIGALDLDADISEKATLEDVAETLERAYVSAPTFKQITPSPKPETTQEETSKDTEEAAQEESSESTKQAEEEKNDTQPPKETSSTEEKESNKTAQEQTGKVAYLTFDDGTSANTTTILDTLKNYNVKATFFLTGYPDPALVKRMAEEGHAVGLHSASHDYSYIYQSSENFWKDMKEEEAYLESITGTDIIIMRFPGGSNNTVSNKYGGTQMMRSLVNEVTEAGYIYFDWNVSAQDATGKKVTKSEIVDNVLKGAENKDYAVVLMHQTADKTNTAQALPEIIEGLQKMGFSFDSLDQDSYRPQFLKVQ